MIETTPTALPLSPAALRAAMAQLQELERAEAAAATERQREAQDQQARERAQRVDEGKARVQAALARYDEAATAVRDAMREVLAAERALSSVTGNGIQSGVLVPPPIVKVHAPSLADMNLNGYGSGFTTTEAMLADLHAALMRGGR